MVEPWRVAQLVADRGPVSGVFLGSGYLIAPGRVLTAAHVVAGASAVRVRLDVGQRTEVDVQAEDWWADPAGCHGTDLAVVMIPEAATAGRAAGQLQFGRIGDSTAVLEVQAFGFPRFKLRTVHDHAGAPAVYRDLAQVTGRAPVAANRRQGTLAISMDGHPPREGSASPWEGMSGGLVCADSRIVGVVAEHHPGEGTGWLTARRIDRAYEQLPPPQLTRFIELAGLPPALTELDEVGSAEPRQLARSAYLEQAFDIVPDELIGRENDLKEWAEFCAGDDPYAWWQAGPWAGKTAMASWFVTHPPAGLDVVSFFITGLSGQADGDAFLDAMIEQLGGPSPGSEGSATSTAARSRTMLNLLKSAAERGKERGQRLVIVEDGLDEDEVGAAPPSRGWPSIASLLPYRLPPGVRVIVTSRPDPGLPDDVAAGHPLRKCTPRRLSVSRVAEGRESRADQELRDLLAGDQVGVDVVGYLAASGGGLTMNDVSRLTEAPPRRLEPILRGVSGRSFATRTRPDPRDPRADPAARVYVFAHRTLRATTERQLGDELTHYRQRIHQWVGSYADDDWPDATPEYAIRGYPRMLAATADLTRLAALTCSPSRHAFLLRTTGSDYAALSEIKIAQGLLAAQSSRHFRTIVELATHRHAILIRNQSIPGELAITWAKLARFDHAEAIARTADSAFRAEALAGVATAAAQVGDLDRARRLVAEAEADARTIDLPSSQARVLAEVAAAAARAGKLDRARRLAAEVETLARRYALPGISSFAHPAAALAQAGDLDRAEALAESITDRRDQARALAWVAAAAAQAGELSRARRLTTDAETSARATAHPFTQAATLTHVVTAAVLAGDLDRARRLAADAEASARAITDSDKARALAWVAAAVAQAGDLDRAEALAESITDPQDMVRALAGVAAAAAEAGDRNRALQLATDAEDLARSMTDSEDQVRVLAELAAAAAQAGDPDRAEDLARSIAYPRVRVRVLAGLAVDVARAGDLGRAEILARTTTSPGDRAHALAGVAAIAAEAGDRNRALRLAAGAEALARTITDPQNQASVLAGLVFVISRAGDPDRAEVLARRTIADPHDRAWALAEVAAALAKAGDLDRAETLARTITSPEVEIRALARVAAVIAQAGDLDRARRLVAEAETLARTITSPQRQVQMLGGLAVEVAEAGDRDRARRLVAEAETLASTISDPEDRASQLAGIVPVALRAGDLDRAETLARIPTGTGNQVLGLTFVILEATEAGDLDRAKRLLAETMIMDPLSLSWVKTVCRFFPSAMEGAWDILASAYAPV